MVCKKIITIEKDFDSNFLDEFFAVTIGPNGFYFVENINYLVVIVNSKQVKINAEDKDKLRRIHSLLRTVYVIGYDQYQDLRLLVDFLELKRRNMGYLVSSVDEVNKLISKIRQEKAASYYKHGRRERRYKVHMPTKHRGKKYE